VADNSTPVRRSLRLAALSAVVVGLCALTSVGDASASPITLGSATGFGLLTGLGETVNIGGAFTLNGNLGLGAGYKVSIAGNNTETGRTYYDNSNGGSWSDSGTYNEQGGSSVTQSMTSILNAASNASTNAGNLYATTGLTDQGGSISANGTSVTIKALSSGQNVLDISSLSLINGTLTFDDNGFSNAVFIVNVTGGFSVSATGSGQSVINGINGANASNILFNIEGTNSSAVSITDTSTASNSIIGTILAPQRNVTLGGGGTLVGELIAGVNNLGQSYTVTEQSSGFNITSYAYVPTTSRVPEPSTIALFGTGLLALFGLRRFLAS
jgi:hypothetical protein